MPSLSITRVVHSCVLLSFGKHTVLTDPWFSEKTGYRRSEPLGVKAADLPRLSGVFISHKHFDHFDLAALSDYPDRDVPFAVLSGLGGAVKKAGFTNVTELKPWETASLGPVTATATPASHGVPEITCVLSGEGYTVFFGADTLFVPELAEIAKRFPRLDMALVPVNGLLIRPMNNRKVVMGPADAAGLCGVLNPRVAVPIHYGHSGGGLMDRVLLKTTGDAESFALAAAALAPLTQVKILAPGKKMTVGPA